MKKFALALAIGTGLAAPAAHAGPSPTPSPATFQSLGTTGMDATTFNSLYAPVNTAVLSPFKFADSSNDSGMIESQVFKYTGSTSDGNPLYAYAYQVAVNPTPSGGDPAHVDSISFKFNATGLDGTPGSNFGYMISGGHVGGLDLAGTQTPTSLTFQPDASNGYIRAQYVDPVNGVGPVGAGSNSATFVLLSKQAPATTMPTVNVGGPEATVSLQKAYVPQAGNIEPTPAPEPATYLVWAGVLGALAVVRRTRKARQAAA
jgi:hypothetical protein